MFHLDFVHTLSSKLRYMVNQRNRSHFSPFSNGSCAEITTVGSRHALVPFWHILQCRWSGGFDSLRREKGIFFRSCTTSNAIAINLDTINLSAICKCDKIFISPYLQFDAGVAASWDLGRFLLVEID